jgi:nitrite reductase (NO-forming)
MREALRDKFREWYIVGGAVCLILGGIFLASMDSGPSAAVAVASLPSGPSGSASANPGGTAAASGVPAAASSAPVSDRPIEFTGNVGSQPGRAALPAAAAPPEAHSIAAEHAHEMVAQQAASGSTSGPAAAAPAKAAAPAADGATAAGGQVFRKCQACHSREPGKNMLGPTLSGILGRKSARVPGYDYSPAMKQASLVWDAATLDAYLADPEQVVPGNKMPFPGLKTGQDRADVIAFLAAAGAGAHESAAAVPAANAPAPPVAPPGPAGADIGFMPDANTRCARALPTDAWSISGSAVRSKARSIPS